MARPRYDSRKAGDQARATRSAPKYKPQSQARQQTYVMDDPNIATGLYQPYLSTYQRPALMQRQMQLPRYGPTPVQPAPYTGPYDMTQSGAQIRSGTNPNTPYTGPYDTTQSAALMASRKPKRNRLAYFNDFYAGWTPEQFADAKARLAYRLEYPSFRPYQLMSGMRGMEGPPSPVQYAPGPGYDYYGSGYGGGGGGYQQAEPRRPGAGFYGSPARYAPSANNWYGQMVNWNISGV
jgi:hypothetical protein